MPVQLTIAERHRIDKIVRHQKKPGAAALRAINLTRKRRGIELIDQTAVYGYIRGETHSRTAVDRRGREAVVTNAQVRTLLTDKIEFKL